ncbi:hypothetical protein CSKR_111544 [Clonorchis sinensis]|uniref:Uncharacterized protein n=1 Tax=Clonorchis sinensis TaxID=79923 RepID=A0A3R7FW79_CLOSI|nr:hypothetical protein CSKR_111544 [Clonorchis sinensis]
MGPSNSEILSTFTPCSFERSSSCSKLIILSSSAVHIQWPCHDSNPGHLTCEASMQPLLHQRTLNASEFSRLNRRTCSHLSDVIDVPDPSNDDPLSHAHNRVVSHLFETTNKILPYS